MGFGEKDHWGCRLYHFISEVHAVQVHYHRSCCPGPPRELPRAFCGRRLLVLRLPRGAPSKDVATRSSRFRSGIPEMGSRLRVESLHKLSGILLLRFILSLLSLFSRWLPSANPWISGSCFQLLSKTTTLPGVSQTVPALVIGSPFSWVLCPLDISCHWCCLFDLPFTLLRTSLHSAMTQGSRLVVRVCCSDLESAVSPRIPEPGCFHSIMVLNTY